MVLPYWFDRPDDEALDIARNAEVSGFSRLWIGEMATFDAFALAGALARETRRIELVLGPLAAGVRSPVALALGLRTVAELGDRPAHLALGASSPQIVDGWHGVPWSGALTRLAETFEATTPILAGERAAYDGERVRTRDFRLRAALRTDPITLAVFGPATLAYGARQADRLVFNLLTEEATGRLCREVTRLAAEAGRPSPRICLWLPIALGAEPALSPAAQKQIASQLCAYLAAPGYDRMFIEAGAEALVDRARGGASRSSLASELSPQILQRFVVTGSWHDTSALEETLRRRFELGVDEIALVPSTADDPGAAQTLSTLARTFQPID